MFLKSLVDGLVRNLKTPYRRLRKSTGRKQIFLVGFSPWKTFMSEWYPEQDVMMTPKVVSQFDWWRKWKPWILWNRDAEIHVWGFNCPSFVKKDAERWNIPLVRVEDGFLRSISLGVTGTAPMSLCFDRSGTLYYDATRQSDLERLIQTYDFEGDQKLMARAKAGIKRLLETRMSKYNTSNDFDPVKLYGEKKRERILVLGQVEGDMSMKLGMKRTMNNNDLVWMAARDFPEAEIIYKPHPEVLHGAKKDQPQSDPEAVCGLARVLMEDVTLADAFETIDRVYTMTSLSGFEALLRDIPVTCVGMPFYAGWGVTDDRQICSRRTARRSVTEIFAAAYILYPRYYDPILQKPMTFEETVDLLAYMRKRMKG